jgi:hypothetical protein
LSPYKAEIKAAGLSDDTAERWQITAEGEGLFKKTEISRNTQMEPASSGPAAMEE